MYTTFNEGNTVIAHRKELNAICVFIFIYELTPILKCSEVCVAE